MLFIFQLFLFFREQRNLCDGRVELSTCFNVSGALTMDFRTYSLTMHKKFEGNMLRFQRLLVPQGLFLNSYLLYLHFLGFLLLLSHWYCLFSQLVHLREWRKKGMSRLRLPWQEYYPIFLYPGVDQLVWLYMIYMLCRLVVLHFFSGICLSC